MIHCLVLIAKIISIKNKLIKLKIKIWFMSLLSFCWLFLGV